MILEHCPIEGTTGHQAGRQLLGRMYEALGRGPMPPILVTDRGKPYFADSDVYFSISHTPHHVFCALCDRPVGLDAEEQTRVLSPRLADKILSPAERERYLQSPDRNAALLRLWVQKEAWLKLLGTGLTGYPDHTDFFPDSPQVQTLWGCFVAVFTGDARSE